MKLFNLFVLLLQIAIYLAIVVTANDEKKIFCLYSEIASQLGINDSYYIENIDFNLCTHLVYDSKELEEDGTVLVAYQSPDNFYINNLKKFNKLKHYNTNLKTLVGFRSYRVLGREENQYTFVESAIKFCLEYNFDGIVVYWTRPDLLIGNSNYRKLILSSLLKKLKQELVKHNLMLVTFCTGTKNSIDNYYNVKDIIQYSDYIYLNTYDFYSVSMSQHTGIYSSLYLHPNETNDDLCVHCAIKNWIMRGAPPDKILMGISFVAKGFKLRDSNNIEPGALFDGPAFTHPSGTTSYGVFCWKLIDENWTTKWESTQKSSFAYKDSEWVGYENEESLEEKAKYVIDSGLAGVAVYAMDDDDFRGNCGKKNPLLRTLNEYLRRDSQNQDFEYIVNVNIIKRRLNDGFNQCVYHYSKKVDLK